MPGLQRRSPLTMVTRGFRLGLRSVGRNDNLDENTTIRFATMALRCY